jgi:predicted GIY-YIG superfamily endonuclease
MTTKTYLYRHYDEAGSLLYIGISLNAYARFAQHKAGADWPKLAVRMETEVFGTRDEAHAAERKAILTENPLFNLARYDGAAKKRDATQKMSINVPKDFYDELRAHMKLTDTPMSDILIDGARRELDRLKKTYGAV